MSWHKNPSDNAIQVVSSVQRAELLCNDQDSGGNTRRQGPSSFANPQGHTGKVLGVCFWKVKSGNSVAWHWRIEAPGLPWFWLYSSPDGKNCSSLDRAEHLGTLLALIMLTVIIKQWLDEVDRDQSGDQHSSPLLSINATLLCPACCYLSSLTPKFLPGSLDPHITSVVVHIARR